MWILEIEDLTHLGGPMGTEYTTSRYLYFHHKENAKKKAQEIYRGKEKLKWQVRANQRIITKDLGSVMFQIYPLKMEDSP